MNLKNRKKLRNKRYAHIYLQEMQDLLLAAQIRMLRKQRGWSQHQLAKHSGMKQARISVLEKAGYSKWTTSTLRSLAEAFDVAVDIRFVSYLTLLDRLEHESADSLKVEKRSTEIEMAMPIVRRKAATIPGPISGPAAKGLKKRKTKTT